MTVTAGIHTPDFTAAGGGLDTALELPKVGGFGDRTPMGMRPDALVKSLRDIVIVLEELAPIRGAGFPRSGTSGTGAGTRANPGVEYQDTTYGTKWINTGTLASPYWELIGRPGTGRTWGFFEDFNDGIGEPLADTDAALIKTSGMRIYGQGIAETDSGLVVNAAGEGGRSARMTTTDEAAHTLAIGLEDLRYQPDQHGWCVFDFEHSQVSAKTLRAVVFGLIGAAADALDPRITFATTVHTMVGDDQALCAFSTEMTDADNWMVSHNKSDENPSMTAVDTGIACPAAGTWQRCRVECGPDPDDATKVIFRVFLDKVQAASVADALDEDEEVTPVLYIESNSAAVKSMDVRRVMFIAGEKANG